MAVDPTIVQALASIASLLRQSVAGGSFGAADSVRVVAAVPLVPWTLPLATVRLVAIDSTREADALGPVALGTYGRDAEVEIVVVPELESSTDVAAAAIQLATVASEVVELVEEQRTLDGTVHDLAFTRVEFDADRFTATLHVYWRTREGL